VAQPGPAPGTVRPKADRIDAGKVLSSPASAFLPLVRSDWRRNGPSVPGIIDARPDHTGTCITRFEGSN
jgi:hypothetical protein